jgi:hypothetical protein
MSTSALNPASTAPKTTTIDSNGCSTAPTQPRKSNGASAIKNFLTKCGVGSGTISTDSNRVLTIEQELAKLASIPKDDYQFDSFWQEYSKGLPKLAVFAKKYLSIPSTSVPSESAFSVSSYILRKNRLGLTSRNVRYTMFLKDKI